MAINDSRCTWRRLGVIAQDGAPKRRQAAENVESARRLGQADKRVHCLAIAAGDRRVSAPKSHARADARVVCTDIQLPVIIVVVINDNYTVFGTPKGRRVAHAKTISQ